MINKGRDSAWCFTGFYGALETHLRTKTWDLLHDLHRQCSLPWLCRCDFNKLLIKWKILKKALDECRLLDLGFVRNKFTWSKKFPNGGMVWERLDRVVSTTKWFDLFPAIKVQTLVYVTSNHNLIIILSDGFGVKPQKPWQFEQMWLKNASCHDIVIGT